jgi:uncharacterized protein (TIGR03067 family)
MTKRIAFLVAVGLPLAVVGMTRADDTKDIQGTWKIERALMGGMEMPAEAREKMTLEFKDGKATVHRGGKDEPADFTLDDAGKPKGIVIKAKNDENLEGIYELKGDSLKICLGRKGEDKPKEFESKEGTKTMLLVLKREKK